MCCDLIFGLCMGKRKGGGKGRASVRPGAPSRLQGERTAPTRFQETSCKTLTSGIDGWEVMSPATSPRRGCSLFLQVHFQPAPTSLSSHARFLLVLKSKKLFYPATSPCSRTHTKHSSSSLPHEKQHPLLGAKLSYWSEVSPYPTPPPRPLYCQPKLKGCSLSTTRLSIRPQHFYLF